MTPDLLRILKFNLFNSSMVYEDKTMVWAAMLTAFFGLLRVSEYTSKSGLLYDNETTLCYDDVILDSNTIRLTLRGSKTDPFRQGVTIRIARNNSVLCPVTAVADYLGFRGCRSGPMFTFTNGKFLTRRNISSLMKKHSGIDANLSSHI